MRQKCETTEYTHNFQLSNVYNVLGLSIQKCPDVLHHSVQKALTAFHRCPGHVGGDDAVGGMKQGIGGQNRLLGYHIHCCKAKLAGFQCLGNIHFVQQTTPGGVQQNRPILHFIQRLPANEALGLGEQGTVERYYIRLSKQSMEIHIVGFAAPVAAVSKHPHSECFCNPLNPLLLRDACSLTVSSA